MLAVAAVIGVGFLLAVFYPRGPTWQIVGMEYRDISFNLDLSTNANVALQLEVYNPNYLSTHVNSISLAMKSNDEEEHTFATITVDGDFKLGPRGKKVVASHMAIDSLPAALGIKMGKEMTSNSGVMVAKAVAEMDLTVAGAGVKLHADCVQTVQADVFPFHVVASECTYFMNGVMLPIIAQ